MTARTAPLKVIITVMRQGDQRAWDVEVSADLPARRLVQMIVKAMGWSDSAMEYHLRLQPGGRKLLPDETLAAAAIYDGALLVLSPAQPG